MLKQLRNIFESIGLLLIIKIISLGLSFTLYAISIFYFNEKFAVTHASLMLVFGVFKSGAGFEAISSGASAFGYVKKRLIVRIFLSLIWLSLFAIFFDMKLTLLATLSIPTALLWLRSFDGHIMGSKVWSIANSLVPSVNIVILGLMLALGLEEANFVFEEEYESVIGILIGLLLVCLLFLRCSLKNTLAEILHSTVSPLLVFCMVTYNFGSNGFEFILYKTFEGLSQVILFVLSSGKSKNILKHFNFLHLSLIVFLILCLSLGIGNFIGGHLAYIIFGAFIFCYYLSGFFIVRFLNDINFIFILLILCTLIPLRMFGLSYFITAYFHFQFSLLYKHIFL